jgi:tRNA dimethylallyltransferase
LPEDVKRLIAIVGPTGIGKSRLALHLAGLFNGEIVSADSRQLYRFLDIGTAKPSKQDLSSVPHHLIDVINPDEDFSLAEYQEMAYRAIADIHRRRKLPFLVGGSGMYVKAILEGWQIPKVSPDDKFRYNIEKKAEQGGAEELHQELCAVDPVAAAKIDRRNIRRIVRALEVYAKSNVPFSRLGYKETPNFERFIIGLTTERDELYRIVDRRVDSMIENGLVTEVDNLLKTSYSFTLPAMSGIGYRQIGQYLTGEITLEEARQKIKTETHRFIRHQYAWFRLNDDRIHWFDTQKHGDGEIEKAVRYYLDNGETITERAQ